MQKNSFRIYLLLVLFISSCKPVNEKHLPLSEIIDSLNWNTQTITFISSQCYDGRDIKNIKYDVPPDDYIKNRFDDINSFLKKRRFVFNGFIDTLPIEGSNIYIFENYFIGHSEIPSIYQNGYAIYTIYDKSQRLVYEYSFDIENAKPVYYKKTSVRKDYLDDRIVSRNKCDDCTEYIGMINALYIVSIFDMKKNKIDIKYCYMCTK